MDRILHLVNYSNQLRKTNPMATNTKVRPRSRSWNYKYSAPPMRRDNIWRMTWMIQTVVGARVRGGYDCGVGGVRVAVADDVHSRRTNGSSIGHWWLPTGGATLLARRAACSGHGGRHSGGGNRHFVVVTLSSLRRRTATHQPLQGNAARHHGW